MVRDNSLCHSPSLTSLLQCSSQDTLHQEEAIVVTCASGVHDVQHAQQRGGGAAGRQGEDYASGNCPQRLTK